MKNLLKLKLPKFVLPTLLTIILLSTLLTATSVKSMLNDHTEATQRLTGYTLANICLNLLNTPLPNAEEIFNTNGCKQVLGQ